MGKCFQMQLMYNTNVQRWSSRLLLQILANYSRILKNYVVAIKCSTYRHTTCEKITFYHFVWYTDFLCMQIYRFRAIYRTIWKPTSTLCMPHNYNKKKKISQLSKPFYPYFLFNWTSICSVFKRAHKQQTALPTNITKQKLNCLSFDSMNFILKNCLYHAVVDP